MRKRTFITSTIAGLVSALALGEAVGHAIESSQRKAFVDAREADLRRQEAETRAEEERVRAEEASAKAMHALAKAEAQTVKREIERKAFRVINHSEPLWPTRVWPAVAARR